MQGALSGLLVSICMVYKELYLVFLFLSTQYSSLYEYAEYGSNLWNRTKMHMNKQAALLIILVSQTVFLFILAFQVSRVILFVTVINDFEIYLGLAFTDAQLFFPFY